MPIKDYLQVFLVSMTPILELRFAIPLGAARNLPWYYVLAVSIVGNMLPIPFILLFIRAILNFMKKTKLLKGLAEKVEKKAEKHKPKILKCAFWGLIFFVGIPIPGTGAWTGALVASMVDMRMKHALPGIFIGVVIAATVMTLASYGFVSFLSIFS